MEFKITITWSKIIALLVLILAAWIDMKSDLEGKVLMFSLPFIVGLITGKQIIDKTKSK